MPKWFMRRYGALIIGIIVVAAAAIFGWREYYPKNINLPMVAVFSPAISNQELLNVIFKTRSKVVGVGPTPYMIVVQSDDPDYDTRLHAAGAWLLLDASGARFCHSRKKNP